MGLEDGSTIYTSIIPRFKVTYTHPLEFRINSSSNVEIKLNLSCYLDTSSAGIDLDMYPLPRHLNIVPSAPHVRALSRSISPPVR